MAAVLLGVTYAWLAAIALSDWRRLRVANPLVGAGAAVVLLAAAAGCHPLGLGLLASLGGAAVVLAVGFALFAMGWVAAGDVKVFAVLGALFGAGTSLVAAWALASVFAAVHIGLWLLLRALRPQLALAPSDPGAGRRKRLPHAVHIALAAALILAGSRHALS